MDVLWTFYPTGTAGDPSSGNLNLQASDFSRGRAFLAKGQADLHRCRSLPSPQELLKETSQGPPALARLLSSHRSSPLTVAGKLRAVGQPAAGPAAYLALAELLQANRTDRG